MTAMPFAQMQLCGDCGAYPSTTPDKCAKCGGYASTVGLTREIATANLTALFKARDEVQITIGATRYVCLGCGNTRRFKPLSDCGRIITGLRTCDGKFEAKPTTEAVYLEDALADFTNWPEAKQAEFLVSIAFGAEIVKTCRRCGEVPCQCAD